MTFLEAQRAARRGGHRLVDAGRTPVTPLQDLLQRTIEQTGRLVRMMTDLLDVSRIQTGQIELHVEPGDLVSLVRRGVEEARLAWPARSLTL